MLLPTLRNTALVWTDDGMRYAYGRDGRVWVASVRDTASKLVAGPAPAARRDSAFRIAGLSVFQDIIDLEPGQRWERELYREIDRGNVLLLFWSSAAAASPRGSRRRSTTRSR